MRLEVTRKSDLAVRLLLVLADGRRRKAAELADELGSTRGFIPQVVSPLARAGWVSSDPGPRGGYALAADPSSISVLDVIEAIEGATRSGMCVLVGRPCAEQDPCALHVPWSRARDHLLDELAATSIVELAASRPGGIAPLVT